MSIFKSASDYGNELESLQDKVNYILNPEKTSPLYIQGFSGYYQTGRIISIIERMEWNKEIHGKTSGKSYHHFILRFDDKLDQNIDIHDIWEASLNIANLLCCPGPDIFLGIMAFHMDSSIPHVHYLIDTIEVQTGQRRYMDNTELRELKRKISQVLDVYGISPVL